MILIVFQDFTDKIENNSGKNSLFINVKKQASELSMGSLHIYVWEYI